MLLQTSCTHQQNLEPRHISLRTAGGGASRRVVFLTLQKIPWCGAPHGTCLYCADNESGHEVCLGRVKLFMKQPITGKTGEAPMIAFRARLQHRMNPLHLYCRLRDMGMSVPNAQRCERVLRAVRLQVGAVLMGIGGNALKAAEIAFFGELPEKSTVPLW